VEPGTIIVCQPGEKIPIDGVVVSGHANLDTAALTGESRPRTVREGDEVLSGCIDLSGLLEIRTTREFEESTASKILDLVENASSRKSRSEEFISRFARIYTPAVVGAAVLLALLPPLARLLLGSAPLWSTWLYRALIFLVISCPCALVISIPLGFFAGIGGAGRAGVLVKGSNYLEALSKTDTLLCDETGTLTEGVFRVTGVYPSEAFRAACGAEDAAGRLLECAAFAESASSHPIAKSLITEYEEKQDAPGLLAARAAARVSDIEEQAGKGVLAKVDGRRVAAGNEALMRELGLRAESAAAEPVGSVIHVAVDGVYAGHVIISDVIKKTAAEAIRQIRAAGVKRIVMLTGDRAGVAEAVAAELGIAEVHSELLPQDKLRFVEALLDQKRGAGALAFVGDGVNDAPVLSRADIGIAMGAMGSDAAIEAADVVLMDDDPLKIAKAIRISRKCLRIIKENIYFAIGVKLLCLLLGALGLANMWLAIFADVGVMVLAVLNAVRALFVKDL
jgi:Cd2+/Zn2+-exporting ATPase